MPKRNRDTLLVAIILVSFIYGVAAEEYEDACFLYSRKDHRGEPLLALRASIKVFETNLVFQLGEGKGINVESVKLNGTNCSVILCDGKHLQGNCSQFTESEKSIIDEKVHHNVRSVDCHCPSVGSVPTENKTEGVSIRAPKLRRISLFPSAPSINEGNKVQEDGSQPGVGASCATIFRDWHYKGQSQSFMFPGSTGQIDVGSEQRKRIRSIYVKNGCKAMLWGSHQNADLSTVSFAESASFIEMNATDNFEWACCYCDQCSESVCSSAVQRTKVSAKTLPEPNSDFSQFVRFGKKIIGIGRNYRWKKAELASVLSIPTEPIVFLKPTTSYITEGQLIELPETLGTIFYELELGIVIGKKGKDIPESQALDYVAGYFLALDMTAKEFIKGKGNKTNLPWEIGKGFDTACPVGDFIPKSFIPDPNNLQLQCSVNGEVTQSENTSQMVFNVQQLISYISRYMTLEPFDTILTGTPDGFGPLKKGDVVQGRMGNLTSIEFEAVSSS